MVNTGYCGTENILGLGSTTVEVLSEVLNFTIVTTFQKGVKSDLKTVPAGFPKYVLEISIFFEQT